MGRTLITNSTKKTSLELANKSLKSLLNQIVSKNCPAGQKTNKNGAQQNKGTK